MSSVRARIERCIDGEVDAILAGRRKFLTGEEIADICLDEAFRDYVDKKVTAQIMAEHPEFSA
jgi:hypothetical protein